MANNVLLASDSFVSGSLSPNWVVFPNASGFKPQIVVGTPNVAEAPDTTHTGGVIWTGTPFPSDHTSEVTMNNTIGTGSQLELFVRVNGAGTAGYQANVSTTGAGTIINYATGASFASGTGSAPAAGDVYALQAAGGVVSLYQNGRRVCYTADATFPSGGSPGFGIRSTSALANCKVASWRCYDTTQQIGIWSKKGIVFPITTTDAASGEWLTGGSCMLDSNPQLISGTQCYKLWFNGGAGSTYYAESPDLINWTRRSSPVITSFVGTFVIKSGGTYYALSEASAGTGPVQALTSSDGITWTNQNSSVITRGSAGAWDSTNIYSIMPITVIGGTFYGLYGGTYNGSGQDVWGVGLATSTDGIHWTKYAGNPVIASPKGVFPSQAVVNVNGTYYMWCECGPTEPVQATGEPFFDPFQTGRFSTTDFIHWSGPVYSIPRTDMYEALNQPTGAGQADGGNGVVFITNINGVANALLGVTHGDNVGPVAGQFALAVAPASIQQISQKPEDAAQAVASDNFAYGAGPLSGNWTIPSGAGTVHVVSGPYAEASATSTNSVALYTGASFNQNQYAEVTIQSLSASSAIASPVVFGSVANNTYYRLALVGATGTQAYSLSIQRFNGSSATQVGPTVGITPTVGDVIRLSVVMNNSQPVLSVFQNGFCVIQAVDESSAAFTSGVPGMFLSEAASGNSQVSLWAGGNAGVIPTYVTWQPLMFKI